MRAPPQCSSDGDGGSEWVHPLRSGASAKLQASLADDFEPQNLKAGKERHPWHLKRSPTVVVHRRPPRFPTFTSFGSRLGLGCDGDSVSITAATQPSIEDVLLGAIPGLPKVHLHNPVLAYENGDEFLKFWYLAEQGKLEPFVLVVEGSIPNEKIKKEGYWAALGTDPKTGQPITTNDWIDRLAPKALAVVAIGTCATYGGIHAMSGQSDGRDGPGGLSRLGMALEGWVADRECAGLPGAA